MTELAAIVGIAGPTLAAEEAALFRRHRPLGAILFRRNVVDPAQLSALTAALREELGADAPILVDQEGGRVARLRAPHWTEFPPPAQFENGADSAAEANAAMLGMECAAAGLDVVCAPCLDLRVAGAHDIIGDRSFSSDPAEVARLGAAWVRGLQSAGCVPVIKHVPGHGRALVDSHESLPRVEAPAEELAADIAPFRDLAACGAWAMTAHILYTAWDAARPATLSPTVIERVIRGAIGFDGVLVSDDLAMGAMGGLSDDLAGASVSAGCDLVLHCTGVLAETAAVLAACPTLSDRGRTRLEAAREAVRRARRPISAVA
jgi:beta-N-acetylhexosaminidase